MKVSIYAMVSSLVAGSLFLSTVCMVRKRICFRRFSDVRIIGMFYLLCLIRLLPLDFTFTRGVNFKGIFSDIWDVLFDQSISIADRYFSVAELLALLALLVSFLKISRFLILYCRIVCQLSSCQSAVLSRYGIFWANQTRRGINSGKRSVLCSGLHICHMQSALSVAGSSCRIQIFQMMNCIISCCMNIVISKDMTCSKTFAADIVLSDLVDTFPFLAMKDFQQILEIRCDRSVTKRMSREEACSYMNMMISCLKRSRVTAPNLPRFPLHWQKNRKTSKRGFSSLRNRRREQINRQFFFLPYGLLLFC